MTTQNIELGFDKEAAWTKVAGRRSVFLDTSCWIRMVDEADDTSCRVRDKLKRLVSAGLVFCPLSWGLLEELFKQAGASLVRSAHLMEELSENVIFVMRTEVYEWEVARYVQRFLGEPIDSSLRGLFAPPAAFVGSRFSLRLPGGTLSDEAQAHLRAFMMRELGKIGVVELVERRGERRIEETPPAYSQAARKAMDITKGDKRKLFFLEATESFKLYAVPVIRTYPEAVVSGWMERFAGQDEDQFLADCRAYLPALHNRIEIMAAVDSEPGRKDKYNDFMDYEIMATPLAYADAFAAKDKGVRHMLRHRTTILERTACHFCDGLDELDNWLAEHFPE